MVNLLHVIVYSANSYCIKLFAWAKVAWEDNLKLAASQVVTPETFFNL